jgi:hypothetical protein
MRLLAITTAAAALTTGVAHADMSIGAGVGTTGFEAQAGVKFNDTFSLRASGNYLNYAVEDQSYDNINYDGELDMNSGGLFVDVKPFQNAFTLTAGAYFGARELALSAQPTTNVDIGGTLYTPAQVGTIEADIQLGDVAPYVGIGYDTTFTGDGRLGFRAALGVAVGDVAATLRSAGGSLSGTPGLNAALQQEADLVTQDADELNYYPVVSIGFTYRL